MKRYSLKEFINKCVSLHGDKYDYSLVEYQSSRKKVKIKCLVHNNIFEITPNHHLIGVGCPICKENIFKLFLNEKFLKFVKKSNLKHNNRYDYSKVNYINADTEIEIVCTEHSSFFQKPKLHSIGGGCPKCFKKDTEWFISKSKDIHGNIYIYDKTVYISSSNKVEIECKKHGIFSQKPNAHLNYQGCPKCKSSKGEKKISKYLEENNISFHQQYRFDECRNILPLPFDFYLPDYNICIEFDGIQHFKSFRKFGGKKKFLITQNNDNIKNVFCLNNNIKLIRIPYYENYREILNKEFNIKSTHIEMVYSKFDNTITLINEYLQDKEKVEYKVLIDSIPHHYSSKASATKSLKEYFGSLITGFILVKEGKQLFIKKF